MKKPKQPLVAAIAILAIIAALLAVGAPNPTAVAQAVSAADRDPALGPAYPHGPSVVGERRVLVHGCTLADQPDASAETKAWLAGIFDDAMVRPTMRHFFDEVSGGKLDLRATTLDTWTELDLPADDPGGLADLGLSGRLGKLCTQSLLDADTTVALADFDVVVNIIDTDAFFAFGGSAQRFPEDVFDTVGMVTLSVAGLRPDTLAHELGHTFGLQHTSSEIEGRPPCNQDDCGNHYSLMAPINHSHFTDNGFGAEPVHPIAFQKEQLGWLDDDDVDDVAPGESRRVSIYAHSTMSTPGVKLLRADVGQSDVYYSFEARVRSEGTYDDGLDEPAIDGVVIHRYALSGLEMMSVGEPRFAHLAVGGTFARDDISITVVERVGADEFVIDIVNDSPADVAGDRFGDAPTLTESGLDLPVGGAATFELGEPRDTFCFAAPDPGFVPTEVGVSDLVKTSWATWQAPTTGTFKIDASSAVDSLLLTAFEGDSFDDFDPVGCDVRISDDVSLTIEAKQGASYAIRLMSQPAFVDPVVDGTALLRVAEVQPEIPPEIPPVEPPAEPTPRCLGREATIVGTDSKDKLVGTPGDDVIVGLGGNDVIRGGGGNDRICGGDGDDKLKGDSGNDKLDGGTGNDTLLGGNGRDLLKGGKGNDKLKGGKDNDKLKGGGGKDNLDGGPGSNDQLDGGPGRDQHRRGKVVRD